MIEFNLAAIAFGFITIFICDIFFFRLYVFQFFILWVFYSFAQSIVPSDVIMPISYLMNKYNWNWAYFFGSVWKKEEEEEEKPHKSKTQADRFDHTDPHQFT